MRKHFIAILLLISVVLPIFSVSTTAAEIRTSEYFIRCTASVSAGGSSGELAVTYRVTTEAEGITKLGVSTIMVYKADGTFYKRIVGTSSNGLIITSGMVCAGTHTIQCEPSTSYYCVVTFISQNTSGYDMRSVTTNTATTPGQIVPIP